MSDTWNNLGRFAASLVLNDELASVLDDDVDNGDCDEYDNGKK